MPAMRPQVLSTRRYRRQAEDLTRVPPRPQKQYKVQSFALAGRHLNWLNDVGKKLETREGINKSSVVRAAIDLLASRFADQSVDDLANYIDSCAADDRDLMIPPQRSAE